MCVIGLDIGGSTTKIVGLREQIVMGSLLVRADDPVASAFGAVGKFLNQYKLTINDVDRIMMTGVGRTFIQGDLLNIKTEKVDEMQAVGAGGLYLSDRDEAIVVSMGTGTSIVRANGRGSRRIVGSGVGGGALVGLGRSLLGTRDFTKIEDLAAQGDLNAVDLTVGDISADAIANLGHDVTASNFGDVKDDAKQEDLAAGVLNLVYQTIGTLAAVTAWKEELRTVVFTGNLALSEIGRSILLKVGALYELDFIVPEHAEFATALGAGIQAWRGDRV